RCQHTSSHCPVPTTRVTAEPTAIPVVPVVDVSAGGAVTVTIAPTAAPHVMATSAAGSTAPIDLRGRDGVVRSRCRARLAGGASSSVTATPAATAASTITGRPSSRGPGRRVPVPPIRPGGSATPGPPPHIRTPGHVATQGYRPACVLQPMFVAGDTTNGSASYCL